MDGISKEGPLFLQGVKFGKKIWRKSWLILFEPSPAGIGRMELYDLRDGGVRTGFGISRPAGLRKTDKRVIRLTDCLSITPAPGESCPTDCSAFFLNTASCTYTIAAPTRDDWVSVLCQLAFQKSHRDADSGRGQKDKYLPLANNELYSSWGTGQFQVSVQSTEASQRCRLSGSYLLSADKETVTLLDLKTGQAIHRWPYRLLRRFGQVKGGIMIEAGRRCHSGEGQFIFLSKQGSQIHRAIEDAIMHQSVQELLAQASALPTESPSQPPSPKSRPQVKKPPPVSVTQERPRPALQCKRGQQIHKAIKEALALPSHTPHPPPPPSPKPKTQGREVKKERAFLPAPPTHKATDGALKYQNVQKLKTPSPPPPPPPPPPLPKNKPQIASKHSAAKTNPVRPGPALPRRNISLPVPPPYVKSSPDDVFYSIICPQPRPRVPPPPPSLSQHFRMHTDPNVIKEKETSSQESSENHTYTNLSNIEDLYSTVNFAAKRKNRQTENDSSGEQKQPADSDFKQTLSSILSKEMSKMTPARSHGGSCEQLDRIDELVDVRDQCVTAALMRVADK